MDMNIQSLQTSKADWRVDNDEPEMVHCMVFGLSSLSFFHRCVSLRSGSFHFITLMLRIFPAGAIHVLPKQVLPVRVLSSMFSHS